ncbi:MULTISPECIES: hypothetical protein [unclassified Bradyrhizobium]|uniref:hypothetical protein n=1 Tax=unclassified Bradyrhizobium TaxID=2631580 RepID=UPI001FFBE872|nr:MULTISPECIES: hypothetical protein [unclassified Bradyrhizobium]MCK1294554.1 hypothetical protein [Bradyrhizobium sp. 30]MCK1315861.1 hypothetical protein [Bradyrhizobium sp. 23]MCK1504651.1 hypothetical protein [Bradyrhizobium sp. 18]
MSSAAPMYVAAMATIGAIVGTDVERASALFFLHERTSELRNQKRNAPNQRCRAEGNHDKRSFTVGLQILFIIHAF